MCVSKLIAKRSPMKHLLTATMITTALALPSEVIGQMLSDEEVRLVRPETVGDYVAACDANLEAQEFDVVIASGSACAAIARTMAQMMAISCLNMNRLGLLDVALEINPARLTSMAADTVDVDVRDLINTLTTYAKTLPEDRPILFLSLGLGEAYPCTPMQ